VIYGLTQRVCFYSGIFFFHPFLSLRIRRARVILPVPISRLWLANTIFEYGYISGFRRFSISTTPFRFLLASLGLTLDSFIEHGRVNTREREALSQLTRHALVAVLCVRSTSSCSSSLFARRRVDSLSIDLDLDFISNVDRQIPKTFRN